MLFSKSIRSVALQSTLLFFCPQVFAQSNQTCGFTRYLDPLEVYSPCFSKFQDTTFEVPESDGKKSQAASWSFFPAQVTDTILNKQLDDFIATLGLSRNFDVFKCEQDSIGHALISNDKKSGVAHRQLFAHPKMKEIFQSEGKFHQESLPFFHAIGHQILRHFFIKGIHFPEFELEADRFAGYAISKQSGSLETYLRAMRNMIVSQDSSGYFPQREARVEAFKSGWEQALVTQTFQKADSLPIYALDKKNVMYFWEGAKRADSLKDHDTALRYYLNAYSYSGGKNRVVLGEALKQAKAVDDPKLAALIGLELLKCGIDLKNKVGYKNLLLEMSAYYQQIADPDKAMQFLELSRKGHEYRTADRFAESRMLFRMGRFEEGRETLTEAIRLGPATSEMYNLYGALSLELGDVQGAIRAYRGVLARNPDEIEAILGLASVYAREALSIAALEEQETDRAEKTRLMEAKTGLFRQAEEVLQAGLTERPGDEQLLMQLLRVYVLIPDEKGARAIKRDLKKIKKS